MYAAKQAGRNGYAGPDGKASFSASPVSAAEPFVSDGGPADVRVAA
jgi:hypothetical protein